MRHRTSRKCMGFESASDPSPRQKFSCSLPRSRQHMYCDHRRPSCLSRRRQHLPNWWSLIWKTMCHLNLHFPILQWYLWTSSPAPCDMHLVAIVSSGALLQTHHKRRGIERPLVGKARMCIHWAQTGTDRPNLSLQTPLGLFGRSHGRRRLGCQWFGLKSQQKFLSTQMLSRRMRSAQAASLLSWCSFPSDHQATKLHHWWFCTGLYHLSLSLSSRTESSQWPQLCAAPTMLQPVKLRRTSFFLFMINLKKFG